MTSPAEIEAWLHDLFLDAQITSGLIDTSHLPVNSLAPEEMSTYQLFRLQPSAAPWIDVGITTLALERLTETQLRLGLRRAIDSATRDHLAGSGDCYIVTSAEIVVPQRMVRGRR